MIKRYLPKAWKFWRWEKITRADDQPYLVRLTLFSCQLFGVYLHWFEGSDDACTHDHPWPGVGMVLDGGYWETDGRGRKFWRGRFSVGLIRPKYAHRVDVGPQGAFTVFLRGPKVREWGFLTPTGWIPWRRYRHSQHCEV